MPIVDRERSDIKVRKMKKKIKEENDVSPIK